MLSLAENALMVVVVVGLSVLLFVGIDRVWAWDKRHQHNDVTGWQLGILGTTYAVILGFMLYAVWTEFDTATQNVELEANGLVNVYRLAEGLPQATRDEVQRLTRSYASTAIEKDWPAMERGELPRDTGEMSWGLSKVLIGAPGSTRSENLAQDHAITEVDAVSNYRRTRLLESTTSLPAVLWFVLVVGGILTIVSSCMFGSQNRFLHGVQVVFFSLLVALVLLAIADINKPFRGSVHVGNDAFVRALELMK